MDDSRFEDLLRALTASPSRRSVLRALGALALGGGVATSFQESEARRCGECKKKKNGRCKNRPNGTYCSVGTCTNGRCGCASIDDCYVHGGNGSDGQVCQEGRCVCTDPISRRCKEFEGWCGECCSGVCSAGRICLFVDGPYRCYCNESVAVDCQQVCIPKECASQCAKSCSGIGANCGCGDYLSCQAEAPGVFNCLPTGKFVPFG
jgi:hypothetical protein